MTNLSNLPPPISNKPQIVSSFNDDGGFGDGDWDFDDLDKKEDEIDISSKDYSNLNLNKLGDEELARHKRAMDKEYNKKYIRPTDPNFVYDR